jgi:hypothetical protein
MGKDGRVIKHATTLYLQNCTFIVRPAGREKVLKTKRKNVHAFIKGEEYEQQGPYIPVRRVKYNPYKAPYFTANDFQIESASHIKLTPDGKAHTLFV